MRLAPGPVTKASRRRTNREHGDDRHEHLCAEPEPERRVGEEGNDGEAHRAALDRLLQDEEDDLNGQETAEPQPTDPAHLGSDEEEEGEGGVGGGEHEGGVEVLVGVRVRVVGVLGSGVGEAMADEHAERGHCRRRPPQVHGHPGYRDRAPLRLRRLRAGQFGSRRIQSMLGLSPSLRLGDN